MDINGEWKISKDFDLINRGVVWANDEIKIDELNDQEVQAEFFRNSPVSYLKGSLRYRDTTKMSIHGLIPYRGDNYYVVAYAEEANGVWRILGSVLKKPHATDDNGGQWDGNRK